MLNGAILFAQSKHPCVKRNPSWSRDLSWVVNRVRGRSVGGVGMLRLRREARLTRLTAALSMTILFYLPLSQNPHPVAETATRVGTRNLLGNGS
jgi:hypothetical protein